MTKVFSGKSSLYAETATTTFSLSSAMASEANDAAANIAARLLAEVDGIQCGQAQCRPPTQRRFSHQPSIADSGFYSSSETNSSTSITPESCRATQEMVHLSRDLLLFYSEKKITVDDASVDLRAEFGDEPTSQALQIFLSSSGVKNANAWDIGSRVATHVLSLLHKDRPDCSCESEMDVEAYLSLVLSIIVPSDASTMYLERARRLCNQRQGEISKHISRVQISLSNSISFPTSPKSPHCEDQRFIPNHLRRQSRNSVRSISSVPSISSWFSTSPSKGPPVPPVVLKHTDPMGSFAVTSPARRSLRNVMCQSARPWGIPSLWALKIPPAPESPLDAAESDGLPTISRTPSTLSITDTVSSSEGPLTPNLVSSPLACETNGKEILGSEEISTPPSPQLPLPKLNPILAKVERTSKFRTTTECSACQKIGLDYPNCPRCGEMWCSRECRLQGGKRHVCMRA